MKKKFSFFTIGLLMGLFCIVCVTAFITRNAPPDPNTRMLKLAHNLDTSHPVHVGMEFMKKRLLELSDGRLQMEIYSGGSLGSEPMCVAQLQNGSLDMTKTSCSQLGTNVRQMRVLALPYLFKDANHFWNILDSDIGEKFLNFPTANTMRGLCFYDAGARSFYTAKKPIRTPEDLEGMKIRVMNSRSDMETIEALGASPSPIATGETYTAISQGVVDGAENNLPTYFTSGHCEIAKYYSFDEHTRVPDILLISEITWKTLSEQEQRILMQAAKESSQFQRELWEKRNNEIFEALKKKDIEFIYPDKSKFIEKVSKIYDKIKGTKIGELADEIKAKK